MEVIKRDHAGNETFRYLGEMLQRKDGELILEAHFGFDEVIVDKMVLRKGDRFVERFFSDRWYNIFEIHDRHDDHLKGWYCNIGHPAVIEKDCVSYRDLALDLLVYPDGRQILLDEEEFMALDISSGTRQKALEGLAELQAYVAQVNDATGQT